MIKAQNTRPARIAIFRCDRIGDVINTLPLASLCKQKWPNSQVTFVSSAYAHEVVKMCKDVDHACYLKEGRIYQSDSVRSLREFLKEAKFDWVCNLFIDAKTAYTIWKACRGAIILGPKSKWYTWLFYTQGKWQKRSQSVLHETQYNQDLLRSPRDGYLRPNLARPEGDTVKTPAILWHPCCGGHALNLSPNSLIKLFQDGSPCCERLPVIFCGVASEKRVLEQLTSEIRALGDWQVSFQVFSSLKDYAKFMVSHLLWVGPSTGPMHLAAALDIPLMTYFSPMKVQHPRRWGPFQTQGVGSSVWLPMNACPSRHHCLKEECQSYRWQMPEACLAQLGDSDFLRHVFDTAERIKKTLFKV